MAKRKYSIRYRKRKNNKSNSKRGGIGTPPFESPALYPVGPLYNPKTGKKYTEKEADEAKKQGIDPYVTKIYQRVELNGSPVLVRN